MVSAVMVRLVLVLNGCINKERLPSSAVDRMEWDVACHSLTTCTQPRVHTTYARHLHTPEAQVHVAHNTHTRPQIHLHGTTFFFLTARVHAPYFISAAPRVHGPSSLTIGWDRIGWDGMRWDGPDDRMSHKQDYKQD
jgi:hypothetical protein